MHARVSTFKTSPDSADALVDGFQSQTEPVQQLDGFEGAYFLVDRASGKAMSITLWQSEAALEESAERANQLRGDAAQPANAEIVGIENYEVAITVGV